MKSILTGLAAVLIAASSSAAIAQSSTDKPISAMPPVGGADHSASTNTTAKTPSGISPGASKEGYAHNTGDVANGPTPPRQTGTQPRTQSSTVGQSPTGQASSTVVPGSAYNHGTGNVGNSNENSGMLGSQGAGASATMQSGHTSNR
jgi:hypothetical protein